MIGSDHACLGWQVEAQHGIARPDMGIALAQHGPARWGHALLQTPQQFGGFRAVGWWLWGSARAIQV
jgi:hypothetical protein